MVMLGAEEVCALVVDIGSNKIKLGYAGDECPKFVYPSAVGISKQAGKPPLVGEVALSMPVEDYELIYPVQGAEIVDWNALTVLLEWGIFDRMGVEREEVPPVLIVEHGAWSRESREHLIQIFFEKIGCAAIYLVRAGQAGAFSLGKHTGLVIDLGAAGAQITPLLDGYAVKGACQYIPQLGGWHLRERLKERLPAVCCSWEVAERKPVELNAPAQWTPKPVKAHETLLAYQRNRVIDDFMATCLQISEIGTQDEHELTMRPPRYYEFPNGFNANYGMERYQMTESLISDETNGLISAILRCIGQCDQDIRNSLLSHCLLIGGLSALPGLSERLTNELAQQAPWGGRVRIQSSPSPSERAWSAWQGGSILASLGSFHHLWMTRAEFQEHGAAHVERKLA